MQGTIVLIAICVICFIVTTAKGGTNAVLINYGGLFKPYIIYLHQYYRFITAAFLHGDIVHLLFNMYAIYLSGSILEPILGTRKFLSLYFISLLTGSLASFAFSSLLTISVGASGGIFGLFASIVLLAKFFPNHYGIRFQSQQFLSILLINLLLGFTPGIDNFAHIGGLIGGIIATYIINLQSDKIKVKSLLLVGLMIIWIVCFYKGISVSF